VARTTAAIGAAFLFAGILLAWYCEVGRLSNRPAFLVQSVGALLLMFGLFASINAS
jgi:hypothetical protein